MDTTLAPAQATDELELDELWTFVGQRVAKYWLWLALCRRTRQVVAYALGSRDAATALVLYQRLPLSYAFCRCHTDSWPAYGPALPAWQHAPSERAGPRNHVERLNATLRARLGRLVRRTLSFSKCARMLEACIRLFLYQYNLSIYPY